MVSGRADRINIQDRSVEDQGSSLESLKAIQQRNNNQEEEDSTRIAAGPGDRWFPHPQVRAYDVRSRVSIRSNLCIVACLVFCLEQGSLRSVGIYNPIYLLSTIGTRRDSVESSSLDIKYHLAAVSF